MPLNRVAIPSPNYSSRGGATVRLVVLHASEWAESWSSLGNFFANPASRVSSHVGIDNLTAGQIGEYVPRTGCAWTAANANPVAVQAELCTPAGASATWNTATWNRHPTMLDNTAAWIAEECAHFGLPIVRLTPAAAQGAGRGVCQHSDLGSWGGGHVDLGAGFPIDAVIAAAAGGPPPLPPEVSDMIAAPCVFTLDNSQQVFYIAGGRLVHWYWSPGRPWVSEGLSTGWDDDSALVHATSSQGTAQVWGVLADGRRAQCYWGGSAHGWITQPL